MAEQIHILLPAHNRREITRRFIGCLKSQTYQNYHLILIDDGSTDGTADMVQGEIVSTTVIKGNGDWWWAGSLHEGYKWLRAQKPLLTDFVLIINDDTEFAADFFDRAVSVLREHPKTFLLAECYDRSSGVLIDAGVHVDWKRFVFEQPSDNKPVNCLSTRGLFFRVGDFFAAGGLHPFLLPHYLSDYEFTIRASRKGFELRTSPVVRVRLDPATTGYHAVQDRSILQSVKLIFSPKSAINPVPLCMFIALACPWQYKASAWLSVLRRSIAAAWKIGTGKNQP